MSSSSSSNDDLVEIYAREYDKNDTNVTNVIRITYELPATITPECLLNNIDGVKSCSFIVPSSCKPAQKVVLIANGNIIATDDKSRDDYEYYQLIQEAKDTDLSTIERTMCVKYSYDANNEPVLIFLPKLGFIKNQESSESQLRLMLLLFLRTINSLVTLEMNYSIVYGHASLSVWNQQPLIYKYWKMLPRVYKKNLQKLYVLHPAMGIKMFFELSRVFISSKFYKKLTYLDSIVDFQEIVKPKLLQLPPSFIKVEDDERGLKPSGVVPPLSISYDSSLGTTRLVADCISYIRRYGMKSVGIFRIAGDELMLTLVKTRIQTDTAYDFMNTFDGTQYIHIGEFTELRRNQEDNVNSGNNTHNDNNRSTATSTSSSSSSSSSDSKNKRKVAKFSTIFINDINAIGQVLKMSLRDMSEPLLTNQAFLKLLQLTKFLDGKMIKFEEYAAEACYIIDEMPAENRFTLLTLLSLLRDVASNSSDNFMDESNLARVFTPTIIKINEMHDMGTGQNVLLKLLQLKPSTSSTSSSSGSSSSSNVVGESQLQLKMSARMMVRISDDHRSGKLDGDTITGMDIPIDDVNGLSIDDMKGGNRNSMSGNVESASMRKLLMKTDTYRGRSSSDSGLLSSPTGNTSPITDRSSISSSNSPKDDVELPVANPSPPGMKRLLQKSGSWRAKNNIVVDDATDSMI